MHCPPILASPASPRARLTALLLALALPLAGPAAAQLRLVPVDAATGLPTAARLQVEDANGMWFCEPDPATRAHRHPGLGGYVHADRDLEIFPAKGPVRVRATRGLSSVPLDTTFLYLGPTTVELPLRDWVDPAALGWYGAEPHAHGTHEHGAVYPATTPGQAAAAARAEGLDLLFLLDNLPSRPGGPVLPPHEGTTLALGEEYRADYWGHVGLLGLDELVLGQGYPGCCGLESSPWPTLDEVLRGRPPSLAWIAHPRSSYGQFLPFRWPHTGMARELRRLALAPPVQAMAVASGNNERGWTVPLYLDALRSGARWAALAEGDVALDRHHMAPPGAMRSYAFVPHGHTGPGDPALASRWQEAVERGASYATTGPVFTHLELAGQRPGSTVLTAPGNPLELAIGLRSFGRLDSVVVHGPAGPLYQWAFDPGRTRFDTTVAVAPLHDGFVVVEAHGPGDDWPQLVHEPRALGSPIWYALGRPMPVPADVARRGVDEMLELLEIVPRQREFGSAAESLATMAYLHEGRLRYEQLVDDPPPAFSLLSPPDGDERGSLRFPLDWEAPPSIDGESLYYRVQLGRSPGLLAPEQDFLVAAPPAIVDGFEPGADWYWTVQAIELGEAPVAATNGPWHFRLREDAVGAPAPPPTLHCRARLAAGQIVVELALPAGGAPVISLYDPRGRRVRRQAIGPLSAGRHELPLPASDGGGARLARGAYHLEAALGDKRAYAKLWLP